MTTIESSLQSWPLRRRCTGVTIILVNNRYVEGSNHPMTEKDADGNIFQLRSLEDRSVHNVLKNFPSEAELCDLIQDFGHSVMITQLEYYWVAQYTAGRPQ